MSEVNTNVGHGLAVVFSLNGKKTLLESGMVQREHFTFDKSNPKDERYLWIHPVTGVPFPAVPEGANDKGKLLHLTQAPQYLGLVEDNSIPLRLTIVSTTKDTYYHFINKASMFVIKVPAPCLSAYEAATNLLLTNLYNGEESYTRMAKVCPQFFEKLFQQCGVERTELTIEFEGKKGLKVPGKLYLNPQDPSENILSVGGRCMDVVLSEFPGRQITRGIADYVISQGREKVVDKQKSEQKLRNFLTTGSRSMKVKPTSEKRRVGTM